MTAFLRLMIGLMIAWGVRAMPLPPEVLPVPAEWALNLQRTFALADTASPTNHPTIRVLHYGLSFSWSSWWWQTAEYLRARYPHVDWQIENHSMSGHTAIALLPLAESEVFPFRPDLIVFHAVGDRDPLAELARQLRKRTTADVLLLGNHIRWDFELADIGYVGGPPLETHLWYQKVWFPEVARTNGLAYTDVRAPWLLHFARTGLPVQAFLSDGVHLNAAGANVMLQFLLPYFDPPRLHPRPDPWAGGRVSSRVTGRDLFWSNNLARVVFTGNRVDALGPASTPWRCRVRVDGRPLSEWPEAYYVGRCSGWPATWSPVCLRMNIAKPPVEQRWTFTVTELLTNAPHFRFRVRGSVSGADREGVTTDRWVSRSGAVFIEPEMWSFSRNYGKPNFVGHEFTFDTFFAGVDMTAAFPLVPAGHHPTVTLFSDLPDGEHVLELEALDASARNLAALRIYHPGGSDVGAESESFSFLAAADATALVTSPTRKVPAMTL
jgi:hypothetical protein